MHSRFISVLILALTPTGALSTTELCDQVEEVRPYQSTKPQFASWSFAAKNFSAKPEQVVPRGFIDLIESTPGMGKVQLSVNHAVHKTTPTLEVWLHAEQKLISEFILQPVIGNSKAVIIEGLRAENPLSTQQNFKLDQKKKSVPLEVFKFMKNSVFEAIRAGGFNTILCKGSQNYTVLMLYRRMIGMKPATESARSFMTMLDEYYDFARHDLPDDLKAHSVQDFTIMIGGTKEPRVTSIMQATFRDYLKYGDKALHTSVKTIKDKNGRTIALVFNIDGKKFVTFVDWTASPTQLIDWNTSAARGQTALELTF